MNSEVQRKWVAGGHVDHGLVLLISDCNSKRTKLLRVSSRHCVSSGDMHRGGRRSDERNGNIYTWSARYFPTNNSSSVRGLWCSWLGWGSYLCYLSESPFYDFPNGVMDSSRLSSIPPPPLNPLQFFLLRPAFENANRSTAIRIGKLRILFCCADGSRGGQTPLPQGFFFQGSRNHRESS